MYKQAVILAGGKGTRLMPLTQNIPKPMVDVAGKPFLHWQLRYLQEQGVTDVLLLVAHLADVVRAYFAAHPFAGLNLEFCVEDTPLGTGGAVAHAHAQLSDTFWLLNGDSFLFIDLPAMARNFEQKSWSACMATVTKDLVPVAGNVRLEGATVLEYRREAGFDHVDAGVYLLRKAVLGGAPSTRQFDIGSLWPSLIRARSLGSFAVKERFFDIGTRDRLAVFAAAVGNYF